MKPLPRFSVMDGVPDFQYFWMTNNFTPYRNYAIYRYAESSISIFEYSSPTSYRFTDVKWHKYNQLVDLLLRRNCVRQITTTALYSGAFVQTDGCGCTVHIMVLCSTAHLHTCTRGCDGNTLLRGSVRSSCSSVRPVLQAHGTQNLLWRYAITF
jgi:hypothetical protein